MFDFLGSIQSQLLDIDSKLSALQSDVAAMRDDLRRLAGKPVLDAYAEWAKKTVDLYAGLQSGVYVEPSVCGPGVKRDFKPDPKDNPSTLFIESFKAFLDSKPKSALSGQGTDEEYQQVFLLSGEAGSGKSTAVSKMTEYILTEYAAIRARDGIKVILLPISLPTLSDPVGSLFEQGAARVYGLRQAQVRTLTT